MEQSTRRLEILSEIGQLSRQQLVAWDDAHFTGWSPEQHATFLERSHRIDRLRHQLAGLAVALDESKMPSNIL